MQPHGIKEGLKRIPLHIGTFGVGSAIGLILLPPGPLNRRATEVRRRNGTDFI
jgi:hypothetical protein